MNSDMKTYKRALTIAGSDPSGGAGIQADLKTFSACGCFGTSAIVAVVDENTVGVTGVHPVPVDFVVGQIRSVLDDIGADAIKIGMLHSSELILAVRDTLAGYDIRNVVLDPVMVATSGDPLLQREAVATLRDELIPRARVITPNIPEAMALLDYEVDSERTQQNAAMLLTRRFGCASLVKGGHFVNEANDVLAEPAPLDDEGNHLGDPLTTWFRHKRIETGNTHGTGCTLSSAIACALAQGMDLADAVNAGKAYLTGALAAGFDMGKGSGPVNHMWQY